jgi:hypothetical protein
LRHCATHGVGRGRGGDAIVEVAGHGGFHIDQGTWLDLSSPKA